MEPCRSILGTPREWAIRLSVATALGGFFGLIGPFGSYAMPLAPRLALWIAGFWLGASLFSVCIRGARPLAGRLDLPEWFVIAVTIALAAAPYSVVLSWMFDGWIRLPRDGRSFLEMYGQTLVIGAPLTAGFVAADHYRRRLAATPVPTAAAEPVAAPASASSAAEPAQGPPFLDRLPQKLGRELLCLGMEDHYVRAHTLRGSDLILIPMRQAVEELDGLEGMRVHRSWWVARTAVEGATEDGRNLRLRLRGGLSVPVARAQVAQVRAAGWLPAEPADTPPRG